MSERADVLEAFVREAMLRLRTAEAAYEEARRIRNEAAESYNRACGELGAAIEFGDPA